MNWVYIWLAVTVLALIVEFITSDFFSIWFAGGGLIALVLAVVNVPWYVHLPVFFVLSFVLILSFRKTVLKFFVKADVHTNADSAIDKDFILLSDISFNQAGTIKVNDVVWNVVTANPREEVKKGTIVKVKEIKGNKYIVEVVK